MSPPLRTQLRSLAAATAAGDATSPEVPALMGLAAQQPVLQGHAAQAGRKREGSSASSPEPLAAPGRAGVAGGAERQLLWTTAPDCQEPEGPGSSLARPPPPTF